MQKHPYPFVAAVILYFGCCSNSFCQFNDVSLIDSFDFDRQIERNLDQWDREGWFDRFDKDPKSEVFDESEFDLEDWEWDNNDEDSEFDGEKGEDEDFWKDLDEEYQVEVFESMNDEAQDLQDRINALEVNQRKLEDLVSKLRDHMRNCADQADAKAAETTKNLINDIKGTIALCGFASLQGVTVTQEIVNGKKYLYKMSDEMRKLKNISHNVATGLYEVAATHSSSQTIKQIETGDKSFTQNYVKAVGEFFINQNPYTSTLYMAVKGIAGLSAAKGHLKNAEEMAKALDALRKAQSPFKQATTRQIHNMADKRDAILKRIPSEYRSSNFDANSIRKGIANAYNNSKKR